MLHLVGHNYDAKDLIQSVFAPLIGVLSSSQAEEICHRNNLSFVEMLQPFTKIPKDAPFSEAGGSAVFARGLRLAFCDVEWRPPQTVLARRMLNVAVCNAHSDITKTINLGNLQLEVPFSEPWFEQWRETFLSVQFPADHEFTRRFLSCIIVLSSTDPHIIDTAHKLTQRVQQMQNITPQKLPKWFHPADVLNSYVILHEGYQNDISRAQQAMELVKSNFGKSKCFLLTLNSSSNGTIANTGIPDYWAPYIKRTPKVDAQTTDSIPLKVPQDALSVSSLPAAAHVPTFTEAPSDSESDMVILHPLSPVQEHAADAMSCKFSISSDSIASQITNTNAWINELESDGPHGSQLSSNDVENLRHFVRDYTVRALVPYIETLILILNESVANKKGVSKSLLSATKRWFISGKPTANANNQNAVIYTSESSELQTRKLGDLHFMFGNYRMAYESFHQAKRDFNADSAWQYYAGALEMAAVSAFMMGTPDRKSYDYMEDAISCYLTVCKLQHFATRATLLSVECLKAARLYGDAAKQLIRMTNEESDLRAALFLEQAAYCFLYSNPIMYRKYALQIVLAGHRFTLAGQRKHSYRCYRQSLQVFQGHCWNLAEDHIHFKIGKHAYVLKKLDEASRSFAHLLRAGSSQSSELHASYLREYIKTQNELFERNPDLGLPTLALPQVKQESVRLLTLVSPAVNCAAQYKPANDIHINSVLHSELIWQKLEEMVVISAASNKPFVFKPTRYLYTKDYPASEKPLAVQNETIELAVTIANSIRTSITLKNIDLLWQLTLDNGEVLSNLLPYERTSESASSHEMSAQYSAVVKTICAENTIVAERSASVLSFKLQPKLTGQLNILGIVCQIAATAEPTVSLLGLQRFEMQRIKDNSQKFNSQTQLVDSRLNIRVLPKSPALSFGFTDVPSNLLAGEIVPVTICLSNLGLNDIEQIYLSCDNPRWFTLLEKADELPITVLNAMKDLSNVKLVKDKEIRRQHVFRLLQKNDRSGVALKALETTTIQAWLQAPYNHGRFVLRLLFYYALPAESNTPIKYRLVRHKWQINVHECLRTEATAVISNPITNEIGLHITTKNNNKLHHPIIAKTYIESVALYSAEYQLNLHKFYGLNETIDTKQAEYCLMPGATDSFECRLERKKDAAVNDNAADDINTMTALLSTRLSCMPVHTSCNMDEFMRSVPALADAHSFLVNNETCYFSSNISAEEFNAIVAAPNPHATLIINWSAVIESDSHIAFGQHFIRLAGLYEMGVCPLSIGSDYDKLNTQAPVKATQELKLPSAIDETQTYGGCEDDDDDFWEPNEQCVSARCLLEDENFTITTKA